MSAISSSAARARAAPRPPTTIQPELELGEPARLRQAAQAEGGPGVRHLRRDGDGRDPRGIGRSRRRRQRGITGEHLVRDDRQLRGAGDVGQARQLVPLQERPGRVVRVHDHQGARPRPLGARVGERLGDAGEVDVPDTVVGQAVGDRRDAFEAGQILEQRIARLGDQHRVPGIAAKLEQERRTIRSSSPSARRRPDRRPRPRARTPPPPRRARWVAPGAPARTSTRRRAPALSAAPHLGTATRRGWDSTRSSR